MVFDQIDWTDVDWKDELKNSIVNFDQLRELFPGREMEDAALREVAHIHPINIPRYYLSLIDPDDAEDPIRKMCFPCADELIVAGDMGETTQDPYGDDRHDKGHGLLHKYDYTALIVASEYCAMYCRHCFRRRTVGRAQEHNTYRFAEAIRYIREHPEITNIVISGGDPLMLSNALLRQLLMDLADIEHLDFVRIGTRVPVTYPLRLFDNGLLDVLEEFNERKTLYLPTHFNHSKEITPTATEAVKRVRRRGITVNNQAVLLRGVNDSADSIVELMNGLLRIGVNPYYLYQCMPVARVRHHFQIPLKRGIEIVDKARQRLDGYGKRFKFIIGHDIGKFEICGMHDGKIVLKQLHGRSGYPEQASRIILQDIDDNDGWVSL